MAARNSLSLTSVPSAAPVRSPQWRGQIIGTGFARPRATQLEGARAERCPRLGGIGLEHLRVALVGLGGWAEIRPHRPRAQGEPVAFQQPTRREVGRRDSHPLGKVPRSFSRSALAADLPWTTGSRSLYGTLPHWAAMASAAAGTAAKLCRQPEALGLLGYDAVP